MNFSKGLASRVYRTLRRVFPRCGMISQATAFNLFLAFFPTVLFAIAVATSRLGGRANLPELIADFTNILPPGSQQFVEEYLVKRAPHAWRWALVGWTGTLLVGSQVMKLIMEGIHVIYGDHERIGFWHRQFRGLVLLLATLVPMLAASILGVLGRPLRHWLAQEFGRRSLLHNSWTVLFQLTAILLSILALTIIYRFARPVEHSLRGVLPGAVLATLLWWFADLLFGAYVRKMQYGQVYGGLGAVIGLMVWLQVSAVIIFLGAAWNAEADSRRRKAEAHG